MAGFFDGLFGEKGVGGKSGKDKRGGGENAAPAVFKPHNSMGDCRCLHCHREFGYDEFIGICTSKECSMTEVWSMELSQMEYVSELGPRHISISAPEKTKGKFKIDESHPIQDQAKDGKHFCPVCKHRFYFYACPHCRFAMPRIRKEALSNTMAPAGIGAAGKTVFMTVLIRRLQEKGIFKKNITLVSTFLEFEHMQRFMEKHNQLFMEGSLLDSTPPGATPPPYLLKTSVKTAGKSGESQAYTLWYDFAGETLENADAKDPIVQYFAPVGGIFFFIDPSNSNGVVQSLGIQPNNSHRANAFRDVKVLTQIRSLMDKYHGSVETPKKKLIAVIVNKIDFFRGASFEFFGEESVVWQLSPHYAAGEFCVDDFLQVNREVKEYVERYHPETYAQLMAFAEDDGANLGFFGVSALGQPPSAGRVEGEINPIRIEDPFYWMLWKMGHMPGSDRGVFLETGRAAIGSASPEGDRAGGALF